jgi:hypothetical protein
MAPFPDSPDAKSIVPPAVAGMKVIEGGAMTASIRAGIAAVLVAASVAAVAEAGEVEIVVAAARQGADGAYRFSVTLRHADTGWDHFADKWDVVTPDGTVLGTRVLLHPHQDEQPFTRSLSGVRVPKGVGRVSIRAHDKVHGYADRTLTVDLGP